MLAAEVAPIAKVGGLGDVVGALPKILFHLGADIKLCLPFYGFIDAKKYKIKKINEKIIVPFAKEKKTIGLYKTNLPETKVPVYLIKHKFFQGKNIYLGPRIKKRDKYTRPMNDIERFSFFTRASLEAARFLNFRPDIIHSHDWHAALAANFIKEGNKKDNFFKNTKIIYTIHNLANQGIAKPKIISFSSLDKNTPIIKADLKNGDINFMVQGILSADIVNTVSPTYAREILTHYQGAGLEKILKKRKKDLYGIINGIDTDFFNPAKDKYIAQNYKINSLDKKLKNKLTLQKKLGLAQDKNTAVVGLVSRLVWQKGVNLITKKFAKLPCQFVFLGTGQKEYENHLLKLAKKYPSQFSAQIKFDEELAHLIYAGADIFLMPSLFEPCGLGQMIASAYGTVPLVRSTGGLADTVTNFRFPISDQILNLKSPPTGFVFKKFNSSSLYKILKAALKIYYGYPKTWRQLQINGMKKDFSWNKSAKEYIKLYKKTNKK